MYFLWKEADLHDFQHNKDKDAFSLNAPFSSRWSRAWKNLTHRSHLTQHTVPRCRNKTASASYLTHWFHSYVEHNYVRTHPFPKLAFSLKCNPAVKRLYSMSNVLNISYFTMTLHCAAAPQAPSISCSVIVRIRWKIRGVLVMWASIVLLVRQPRQICMVTHSTAPRIVHIRAGRRLDGDTNWCGLFLVKEVLTAGMINVELIQ